MSRTRNARTGPACHIPACACLLFVAACGYDGGLRASSRVATATRDLTIDSTPFAEFGRGGKDEDGGFERAAAGTRLSTGEIVIVDSRENHVSYFDRRGRSVRSFGRTGGGPNGFRAASWAGRCAGDSVFVWDPLERRIVVLDPTGTFARDYQQPGDAAIMRCSSDGKFAILMSPARIDRPMKAGTSARQLVKLQLANAVGDTTLLLGEVPFTENSPLGRGSFVAIARNRLYMGTADSGFVDAYSLDGKRMGPVLVMGNARRQPTSRNYQRIIDDIVAGLRNPGDQDAARHYLQKIPMPDVLPPYSGLFGSPDGTLWINASALGDSETVLRAVTPSGYLLGEIHIPVDLRVFEIGGDYILGAYEDRDGTDRVVLYRVGVRRKPG